MVEARGSQKDCCNNICGGRLGAPVSPNHGTHVLLSLNQSLEFGFYFLLIISKHKIRIGFEF